MALAGIVVGVFYTRWAIRDEARAAVLDDSFIAKLAEKARPTRVFCSDKTTEYDSGTQEFIDDIESIPNPKEYGFTIHIKFRKFLKNAPWVSSIDSDLVQQSAVRSPGTAYDWTIVMRPQGVYSSIVDGTPMDLKRIYRFRLELLH